jgi:hypothetical protein
LVVSARESRMRLLAVAAVVAALIASAGGRCARCAGN